jgi:hypothetical protein
LALALLLELRMYDAPKRPPTLSMLNYGLLRATLFGGFLWVAGISCYGEWVCLRSLELDRLVGGGTLAVWTAIVDLAALVLSALALRVLMVPPD